jgi:hypothetical protein
MTQFKPGNRVRILRPVSEYTGCRGTIAEDPSGALPEGIAPLGHFVAIDGENGIIRPFLLSDLVLLRARRVRPPGAGEPGAVQGVYGS